MGDGQASDLIFIVNASPDTRMKTLVRLCIHSISGGKLGIRDLDVSGEPRWLRRTY